MSWRGARGARGYRRAGTRCVLAVAVALAPLAGPAVARAQGQGQPAPAIDPQAIAALNAMGAYLRSQTAMRVMAEMTTDDVINTGQKVQVSGTVDMEVRRPDR